MASPCGQKDEQRMRMFAQAFRKIHCYILCGLGVPFSLLTLWVVLHMSPGDWNDWRGPHPYRATLLTITGPFTGAILRPFEPYSWKIAWGCFPFCAAPLLIGGLFQIIPLPFRRGAQGLRLTMWVLGLLGWFVGGFLSLICSLE